MSIPFAQSETKVNLMRAFAGESQARNRYTFAAGLAQKKDLEVIRGVFLFTARQEEQHAKLFYQQLKELSGENIRIDGSYPVELFPDLLDHLKAARHNEYQEWKEDYAGFARTAEEEGFSDLARLFTSVAGIEQTHGDRFGRYAQLLEEGKLFLSDVECSWMCLNCGQVVRSTAAPAVCPTCKHPQGFFVRWELTCREW